MEDSENDITIRESAGWNAIEMREMAARFLGRKFAGGDQPLNITFNTVNTQTGVSTEVNVVDLLVEFRKLSIE